MLSKKNRISKKEVDLIFKRGRFTTSPSLTFKFILNNSSTIPRISVIVPKNVTKFAVRRNFLRRRAYNILRKYIEQSSLGIIGVFVFRKYQDDILIIEDEIKNILNKIN